MMTTQAESRMPQHPPAIDASCLQAPWFVDTDMSHKETTRKLSSVHYRPGAFLVRRSRSKPGNYVLSFADSDRQLHNEAIVFGQGAFKGVRLARSKVTFNWLSELIQFYSNPMSRTVSALPCVLDPNAFAAHHEETPAQPTGPRSVPGASGNLSQWAVNPGLSPRSARPKHSPPTNGQAARTSNGGPRGPHSKAAPKAIPEGLTVLKFEVIVEEVQPPSEVDVIVKSKAAMSGQGSLPSLGETVSRPVSQTVSRPVSRPDSQGTEPEMRTGADRNMQHLQLLNLDRSAISMEVLPRLGGEHWQEDNTEDWIFEDPLDAWTTGDVQEWLYSIDMGEHAKQFEATGIDGTRLAELEDDQLLAMGMTPEKLRLFKKHLKAVSRRKPRSASASQRNSTLNLFRFPTVFKPPADPPQDWDQFTVRNWLLSEGFDEAFAQTMVRNEVTGAMLLGLDEHDVRAMELDPMDPDVQRLLHLTESLAEHAQGDEDIPMRPRQVEAWTPDHVHAFLEEEGFDVYADTFRQRRINGRALLALNEQTLGQLGVIEEEQEALLESIKGWYEAGHRSADVRSWSNREVLQALRNSGEWDEALLAKVEASGVDGARFLTLTHADLTRMGITDEHDQDDLLDVAGQLQDMQDDYDGTESRTHDDDRAGIPSPAVALWEPREVGQWLTAIGEGVLVPRFVQAGVTGERLLKMEPRSLYTLGVTDPSDLQALQTEVGRLNRRHALEMRRHAQKPYMQEHEVEITCEPGARLGIEMGGGEGNPMAPDYTVNLVLANTPADGKLEPGDQIVAVNERYVEEGTLQNLKKLLGRAKPNLRLRILRPAKLAPIYSNVPSQPNTPRRRSDRRMPHSPDVLSDPRQSFRRTEADLVDSGLRGTPTIYQPPGGRRASAGVDDGSTHHSPLLANRSGFEDPRTAREAALQAARDRNVPVTTDHGLRRVERAPSFSHQDLEDIVKSSDRALMQRRDSTARGRMDSLVRAPSIQDGNLSSLDSSMSLSVLGAAWSEGHPMRWDQTAAGFYLESQQLPALAAQARRRQITGSRLLSMQLPEDLAAFDVPVAEKTAAFPVLRKLQQDYPLPFAAHWSVADVGEWLDHRGYGALKKSFAKRKLDGATLCNLTTTQLDTMEVPANYRHQLLQDVSELRGLPHPDPGNAPQWSAPEVEAWLNSQGLSHLGPVLRARKVTGAELLTVKDHNDLIHLQVRKPSDQVELLNRIDKLRPHVPATPGLTSPGRVRHHSNEDFPGPNSQPVSVRAASLDKVEEWTPLQVCDWLFYQDLGTFCAQFAAHNVDGSALLSLDSQALIDMGIEGSDAVAIGNAVDVLSAQMNPTAVARQAQELALWRMNAGATSLWLNSLGVSSSSFDSRNVDGAKLTLMDGDEMMRRCHDSKVREDIRQGVDDLLEVTSHPLMTSVYSWTVEQVCQWLKRQGLGNLCTMFVNNGVAGDTLLHLQALSLHKMGIANHSHQTTLLVCIDRLKKEAYASGRSAGVMQWTCNDVVQWLDANELGFAVERFHAFGISGPLLLKLTGQDLDIIFEGQLPMTQQNHLLATLSKLRSTQRIHSLRQSVTNGQRPHDPHSPVNNWTLTEVGHWLHGLGLDELRAPFMTSSISGAALLRLSPDDLDSMGVDDLTPRANLLTAVARLRMAEDVSGTSGHVFKGADDSLSEADIRAGWTRPSVLPARAAKLLEGAPPGHFLIHQAENTGHYELSYVNQQGQVVMPGLTHRHDGGIHTTNSPHSFATFSELVAYYADDDHTDQDVTVQLLPSATAMRLRAVDSQPEHPGTPVMSRGDSSVALAPWDKTKERNFDAARLLRDRTPGSFFVTKASTTDYVLHVRTEHGVERFGIGSSPGVGYQLFGIDDKRSPIMPTLAALIERYYEKQDELPLALTDLDVKSTILHSIRSRQDVFEEPFCWWQPTLSLGQVEQLLASKKTGACVVTYGHPTKTFPLLLVYKVGNQLRQEEIYKTPGGRVSAGFHLAVSQNKVLPTLTDLVHHYTERSVELDCPLRVFEDPTEPVALERAAPKNKSSPFSWCQLGLNASLALKRLEDRAVGSFVVYYHDGLHRLAYKTSSEVKRHDIVQTKHATGKTAFQLAGDRDHEFPTLWDLVSFHENNAHSLDSKLTVAVASLLQRAANKPGLSPTLLGPQDWIWCQVGLPKVQALATLAKDRIPGTFVVRSPESSDVTDGAVGVALVLSYLNQQSDLVNARILLLENPNNPAQQALALQSNTKQMFQNVEQLLLALIKDKSLSSGVQLLLPAIQTNTPSWSSPSLLRRATSRQEEPWNWWQLGQPAAEALKVLKNKSSGAFVIRDHPEQSNAYILSYVFREQIFEEKITYAPRSTLFEQGFHLEADAKAVYPDLQALVKAHSQRITLLKCLLRVSQSPPESAATPQGGPASGVRSRTFDSLQKAAEHSNQALTQFSPASNTTDSLV
eukprot:m.286663 g.286663  ORF g.286663 m.286663 type:complete len:2432 (-) comp17779_c0_seq1:271-7566(-)